LSFVVLISRQVSFESVFRPDLFHESYLVPNRLALELKMKVEIKYHSRLKEAEVKAHVKTMKLGVQKEQVTKAEDGNKIFLNEIQETIHFIHFIHFIRSD
jgi:hypothetical protein